MKKRFLSILLIVALCQSLLIVPALGATETSSAPDIAQNAVSCQITADGKTVGTVYFTLDSTRRTACLVLADRDTPVDGMLTVPKVITHGGVDYTVTAIGHSAFAGQTGLTQLWLPDTVGEIGNDAFMNCDHLKAVGTYDGQDYAEPYALPQGLLLIQPRTFRGCVRLGGVVIPASVQRVDSWAFAYCYSLKEAAFASGSRLNTISQGAFTYCSSLQSLTLPDALTSISDDAFAYCGALRAVTIPAGVKTLPKRAFYACSALETVDFTGDGLTDMGYSAFYWCTHLTTIRTAGKAGLPATLVSIPRWAFYRCDSLAQLDLSSATALRTIEPYAFNESGVVDLTLPQNLKTIGLLAFEGCGKLKTIDWNRPDNDEDLLEIGEKAFAKTGLTQVTVPQLLHGNANGLEMFYDCDSLTQVDCAPNARFIPDGAFRDCDNLSSVTLGKNIDTVGKQSFYSCPKLTQANLADASSLATIGPLAFCRTALPSVSLPASINDIGLNAFGINRALTSIEVADGNPGRYYCVDGVLYQNNPDVNGGSVLLVKYPAGKAGTTFDVPEGVTAIESYAFSHSEKLTQVTFPTSLRIIGYYALSHCINLTTANVPADVEQGDEIFEGSYHMTQVTLPPGLTKLDSSSIPVNSKVTSITLPASVAEIDILSPFSSLSLLEEILVDAANPNFKSVDGVLFSKDGKTLYAYPPAKAGSAYVVPDTVTTIWHSAFVGAANLERLTIPASVETVGSSACYDLPKLSRLDLYREDMVMTVDPNKAGYHKFLGNCAQDVEVYLTGDPNAPASRDTFYSTCLTASDNTVKLNNIHVGYFKTPTQAGDRFMENGVIYTVKDPAAKTVTVGNNTHYAASQLTVPALVSHEGVTYTVNAIEDSAFAAVALTSATVMLDVDQIAANAFDSGLTVSTRNDLASLTAGQSVLAYGDVLIVNTPAQVSEGDTITLTANGKSLSATVQGGVASFPVDRAMADAFGFGALAVSASGGGATGQFTLTLEPKTLTIADLPWFNSSLKYFLVEKPYDGTAHLDYTERAALKNFTVAGDDLALQVTGTLPVECSTRLHGNADSDTQLSVALTGSAAKYYQIGADVLSHIRVQVVKGQLYIKEFNGELQQPTFHRVWAAEDGLRVKDCNLSGGSFIAYLPTVENGEITGYTLVDVNGSIQYTDENHWPGLSSFDEIGVQQDQVYHWAFVPSDNGELQETLSNYMFQGAVKLWDTSLTKGTDPDQGTAGENPGLPAYVLAAQDGAPEEPGDQGGAVATAPYLPTETPEPSESAAPSESSAPSASPTPSESAAPSDSPAPSASPTPSASPAPSESPAPSASPTPSESPAPSESTPPASPSPSTPSKPSSGSSSRPASGGGTSGGGTGSASTPPPAETTNQPTASTSATPVSARFHDISPNAWYCDAVQYVYDKGMIRGMSETSFAPAATTTRGAIVTMLHRLEAEPAAAISSTFRDVSDQLWYTKSVTWAAASGIVNGYEDNSFRPDDPITREQLATILYRYATMKGLDVTAPADLSAFADAGQVSPYAVQAMAWANAKGIVTGKGGGILDPKGQATRAEAAAMLQRFCEGLE